MTNATICGAGRGPCNDPTLGEFLLIKEMVCYPKCQMSTEVGLALAGWCAPNRAPERR